jgi:hypothetical protein
LALQFNWGLCNPVLVIQILKYLTHGDYCHSLDLYYIYLYYCSRNYRKYDIPHRFVRKYLLQHCVYKTVVFIILDYYLMQIEFKQWWPTSPAITSYIKLLNIKKGMTYVVGNPGHGLRQTQKCGEDKPVNPNSPFW